MKIGAAALYEADGIYLRRSWGGEYENAAVPVAIAVNEDVYREVPGAAEGMKEDKASWVGFFQWLRGRGPDGIKLVAGDKCLGMLLVCCWYAGGCGRSVPGGQIPAVYRPFLPQCLFCDAAL